MIGTLELSLSIQGVASCTTIWGFSGVGLKVNDIIRSLAGPDPNLPMPQRDMAPPSQDGISDGVTVDFAAGLSSRLGQLTVHAVSPPRLLRCPHH